MKHIALVVVALAGCEPAIHYNYAQEPDPRKSEYVIGVGDSLRIQVWKNPELSAEVRVRPDGTITLPLVGDIAAAGRHPSLLKLEIVRKLAAYVKDEAAVVTIAVTDPNSYHVAVSGNVEHPGVFPSKSYLTVSDAIALAGGPNKYAGNVMVVIREGNGGAQRRIPIDYRRVRSGAHPEENLALFSGDSIYVP